MQNIPTWGARPATPGSRDNHFWWRRGGTNSYTFRTFEIAVRIGASPPNSLIVPASSTLHPHYMVPGLAQAPLPAGDTATWGAPPELRCALSSHDRCITVPQTHGRRPVPTRTRQHRRM